MKKIIASLLALVLIAGLFTACQTGGQSSSSAASESSQASTESSAASDASGEESESSEASSGTEATGMTAFENQVTLKIPVYDRGVEGVPDVSSNYWTGWVQENFGDQYNVKVEYVPITRNDVMTDYALMAAGQTLPTMLTEFDYPKLAQWANEGYLTTFNMDDFAAMAPTYFQKMSDNGMLPYTEMGGETYYVMGERPDWNTGYTWQTFVRMDWLRQVGYDYVPVKKAEVYDALDKIKEAGLSQYPLGGNMLTGLGADQNYNYRDFPESADQWAQYSSITVYALDPTYQPAHDLLKVLNYEHNKGYSNPEYYITDTETNKAAFVNGDTYQFAWYINASADWLSSFYSNNPDAELALVPLLTEDDDLSGIEGLEGITITPAYRADSPFGVIVGFSSTATEDEIKAAWMYLEWLSQDENITTMQWGFEGENFTNDENGLPTSVLDYDGEFKQGYSYNSDYFSIVRQGREIGTKEQTIAANVPVGLPQDFTAEVIEYYNGRKDLAAKGYAMNDPIFSVALASETEYSASLQSLYLEYHDKLVMCTPEEFDALYEELGNSYLDAGFRQVIEERKTAYDEGNSTKQAG